ncbi:MAG: hypothetical protein JWQ53_1255 [Klenkia sp.]|nr:hypothetical protein [Klenkia sp.]
MVDVAGLQAERGHAVAVVGGAEATMTDLLPRSVTWAPGGTAATALRSLVRRGRRDVLHSHMAKADFAVLAAAPATGGRRFSTRHITALRGHGKAARLLSPLVRRGLTAELAVSRFVADQLTPHPDVVMLNGVLPQADIAAQREPLVVMAHRLAPEKDTPTGLRAWAASGLGDRGWRLVVAGDGPDRTALEDLSSELGIDDSTDFPGWVSAPEALFRRASVVLAPAPAEPCGLSILEAMAWGTPVVTTASGGPLETVGRAHDAALFPPGDAAAAARLLVRLADDEGARQAYGSSLRDLQRTEFDLAGHVDRLDQVYRTGRLADLSGTGTRGNGSAP